MGFPENQTSLFVFTPWVIKVVFFKHQHQLFEPKQNQVSSGISEAQWVETGQQGQR